MLSILEIFQKGIGTQNFRDIIDNLLDEQIFECEEYANQFKWQYPRKGEFPDYNKDCLVIPFKGEKYIRALKNNEYGDYWVGQIEKWCYLPIE